MARRYKNVTLRPPSGGRLITQFSENNPTAADYIRKLNFRREYEREVLREGDLLFQILSGDPGNTPYPQQVTPVDIPEPITLLHTARSPTGVATLIAATKSRLYRFIGDGSLNVYELDVDNDGTDDDPVFDQDDPNTAPNEQVFQAADGWIDITPEDSGDLITSGALTAGVTYKIIGNEGTADFTLFGAADNELNTFFRAQDLGSGLTPSWATGDSLVEAVQSGFSEQGHRWEAVNVAGKVVLNNGYDLPVVYDLGAFQAVPLYELRESGVAYVGTISEFNGMLVCGDVAEIREDYLETVMTVGDIPVWTNGASITAGDRRAFEGRVYTAVSSGTTSGTFPEDDTGVTWVDNNESADPYGFFINLQQINRIQYRFIHSAIGGPGRWGAFVEGSMNAGFPEVTLAYEMKSFQVGDSIRVPGAAGPGDLVATIDSIDATGKILTLDTDASATVTDVEVIKSDFLTLAPQPGFYDLQDDSSGIIRITKLRERVVVLKDTSILLGVYTSSGSNPFSFKIVYRGFESIFWKWALANVDEEYLIFAGRSKFYQFDLTRQRPVEHEHLTPCDNLFFDDIVLEDRDRTYAAVNAVTKEVWFCFPGAKETKGICFDFRWKTVSTIDRYYSAATTLKFVGPGIVPPLTDDWFVMGQETGTILLYGRAAHDLDVFGGGRAVFTRWDEETGRGEKFSHVVRSGRSGFKEEYQEKDLRAHVLILATQSQPDAVKLTLYSSRNPADTEVVRSTRVLTNPETRNLWPVYFRDTYFSDEIEVETSVDFQIASRIFDYVEIDSRSVTRG